MQALTAEPWSVSQREQPGKVSFDCNEELHRQEVQDAGDIRLSIVLLRTCMADKQQFCAHVPYGTHHFPDFSRCTRPPLTPVRRTRKHASTPISWSRR